METKALIVIPIFPQARNLARLEDALTSIKIFEPGRVKILLMVDGPDPGACRRLLEKVGLPGETLLNPRNGKGSGWEGGLTLGLLTAFKHSAKKIDWDILVRMDDDALVLAPFIDRLLAVKKENPFADMFGGYEFGEPLKPGKSNWFSPHFERRASLLRYHDQLGGWWFSGFGWKRKVRLLLRAALRNGYIFGEWCQGGAYAFTPNGLKSLVAHSLLRNPFDYLPCGGFTEDFFFTIAARASGIKVWYEDDVKRIFAVKWKGLSHPPDVLIERRYCFIHSVKLDDEKAERDLRAYFQKAIRLRALNLPVVT